MRAWSRLGKGTVRHAPKSLDPSVFSTLTGSVLLCGPACRYSADRLNPSQASNEPKPREFRMLRREMVASLGFLL